MNPFLAHHKDKYYIAENGCMVWTASFRGREPSYGQATWNGKQGYAHRYAYEAHNGPIPDGMLVRHKCDNTKCVNPDHLEIGTHVDNMRDAVVRKRTRKGERHHNNKICARDVVAIKKAHELGVSQRELSDRYGLSQSQMSRIILGKRWGHISI